LKKNVLNPALKFLDKDSLNLKLGMNLPGTDVVWKSSDSGDLKWFRRAQEF